MPPTPFSAHFNFSSLTKMAEELPFAPSKMYPRSDEEIATFKALKKERSGKCFVYVFSAIVILSIVVLAFAMIVLRFKISDVKLRSVTVKNLKYEGRGTAGQSPSFNATLVAEVTIKNTNFGRFKFDNSTLSVLYGGMNVGNRSIIHGRVKARETHEMNITVEVRSNRVMDTKNLSGDIEAGMLKLSSYAKLSGRVNLMNIMRKRKTTEMNCTMILDLKRRAFQGLRCY